ncbi:MAG: galactose mutarotase [Defluviitaleaceae bacterium]|nr:galactose mutarotase [Defluviitaleaceae bacterium]
MKIYKLSNKNGMEMTVTNLGCAIMKLIVPAKDGAKDIVFGFDTVEEYAKPHPFFGVVAGRFANRIGQGKFTLGGKEYQLETNDGAHHLHGGAEGFDKKVWDVAEATDSKIVFTYDSPDGDAKYPGNLLAKVTYTLGDDNVLRIDYHATTATETICNLTNHSYFNLSGHDAGNIYDHQLEILADKTTAVDTGLIPTGEFAAVAGTPFDFRVAKPIGQDIKAAGEVNNTGGYDHNFVLNAPGKAASVYSPKTGIRMEVFTDSPGIQLYTSNMIEGGGLAAGKGAKYPVHSGFCLETQLFPDGVNHAHFPSAVVTKDKPQQFYTEFRFSW